MRINTNIASMTAQENAANVNKNLSSSLEKLSSGLRINKASDDASGMSIADKLRTQASALGQSISNANSANALVQIADKAMGEQSNILDIVKTKLIQASTQTTSDEGREAIRKDVAKLLEQLDNIAGQTNYNGINLLDTKGAEFSFQVGEKAEYDISTTTAFAANTNGLGNAVAQENTLTLTAANATRYSVSIDDLDADGNALGTATTVSFDSDADATIDEIHAGLKAAIEADTTLAAKVTVTDQTESGDASFVITNNTNNQAISVISSTYGLDAVDSDGTAFSSATDTSKLTLSDDVTAAATATAEATVAKFKALADGESITIGGLTLTMSGGAATAAQVAAGFASLAENATTGVAVTNGAFTGTLTGWSTGVVANTDEVTFTSSTVGEDVTDLAFTTDAVAGDPTLTTTDAVEGKEIDRAVISADEATNYELKIGSDVVNYQSKAGDTAEEIHAGLKAAFEANTTLAAGFTIVAFDSANPTNFDVKNNTANDDFTLAVKTTSIADTSGAANVETAEAGAENEVLTGLKNLGADELTSEIANDFMAVVDTALSNINTIRSDFGSTQNQLDSFIRNAMTTQTNIKAAESVIRDVDYAAESANFNKQNIIAQAGTYAMSQANAVQQNVMRLLQ